MKKKFYEFTEYHSPDGEVYRFQTGDKFSFSETGMGMPPISYQVARGPFQHGETVVDYRLEPRIIQLEHRRNGCSRSEYWANRSDLINLLRPNRQTAGYFDLGTLRKRYDNGTIRDIDCLIEQGPIFAPSQPNQWDEWAFQETLRFVCPDPTFYDPETNYVSWTLSQQDHLVFPITFPIQFGTNIIDNNETVNYVGTWLAYPNIVITGPIVGFTITNETTGEFIRLNYTISPGEQVTIGLSFANKTIENGSGDNLIGYVSTDSDLATFHIAPDPEAPDGTNVFNVTGGGSIVGTTAVTLSWCDRYIGI